MTKTLQELAAAARLTPDHAECDDEHNRAMRALMRRFRRLLTNDQFEALEDCRDDNELIDLGMRLALGDDWREHVANLNLDPTGKLGA